MQNFSFQFSCLNVQPTGPLKEGKYLYLYYIIGALQKGFSNCLLIFVKLLPEDFNIVKICNIPILRLFLMTNIL